LPWRLRRLSCLNFWQLGLSQGRHAAMLQFPEYVSLAGKEFWTPTREARCCYRLGCTQAERLGATSYRNR
jgi:hypothetical protein